MKKHKIIFWITTTILFLFEGVLPAFTGGSEMSIQGITHLGYPIYFVYMLTVFKVLGGFALIIPAVPRRVKEWAYAGYGIDFIAAFVSIWAVDGFNGALAFPAIAAVILVLSYVSYTKINSQPKIA
jgi:DoxX-like family